MLRTVPSIALLLFLASAVLADDPPTRTWTDATGSHKIRAALVKVEGDAVRLKRADSEIQITVPLSKLSEADRTYVAGLAKTPAAAAKSAPAGEWPWWRGTNYDAKSPDTGLLKVWPEGGPKLLWKATDLGQGFSGVAVSRETVYITGEKDDKLWIYAYDLAGKRKWRVEHGPAWTKNYPGARSTPSAYGNCLYVLSGHGQLGCFNTDTGKQKWSIEAKDFGGSPGEWGYAESPLLWGRLVIFKPGGANCIVAVDRHTGKKVWASQGINAGPEYSSCLPIYRDHKYMVVTGTRAGLVAVRVKNGELLWQNKFAENNVANCATPSYSEPFVFWANGYGKGGICLKLTAEGKAEEAWTTSHMVCHHGGYVIDDGYIYGNDENGWSCLELVTGKQMWHEKGIGKGSLCWADGMLYLFAENGGRAALATCSPKGLKITGRVTVQGDGPSWAHPVVVGGRLYLRYDTTLYCFDVQAKK